MTTSFADLGLSPETLRALAEATHETPTPIQEQAIPAVLRNRDVLGCAQTGTGKTASFVLPIIEILSQGRARARMPRSLILAPTRELAAQAADNLALYGKYHRLSTALLIGGVPFTEQERALARGVDVLIATPGRLLDHCERGRILLTDTKILVIDEADRMLDMGFIPDVERILALLPSTHQTLMFSATMAPEIRRLAERFLQNPQEITVDPPSSIADTVTQSLCFVSPRRKQTVLRAWIRMEEVRNGLVFCNRKRDVAALSRSLQQAGFSVGALHGDMDQYQRMEWLEKFRSGEISFLICSDVAARGLDIPRVSHVFNYDVPIHAEDYVHRIGRTGRAGLSGVARTLATEDDAKFIDAITTLIGRPIPVVNEATVVQEDAPLKSASTSKSAKTIAAQALAKDKTTKGLAAKSAPARSAAKAIATKSLPKDDAPKAAPATKTVTVADSPPSAPRPAPAKRTPAPRRGAMEGISAAPLPFGKTNFVPAFLLRSATLD